MGGWIQVECNCENRRSADGSLTCREYDCGHDDGTLVGLALGVVFFVGDAVRVTFGDRCSTFETFLKVINPKSYVYEQLVLTPEERDFWALEVEQIRNYLNDSPPMAWEYRQRWNAYWELPGELGPDPLSNREFLRGIGGEVEDILDDISRVCKASVTTDNPIELSLQRRDDSDDPAAGAILFRAHFV